MSNFYTNAKNPRTGKVEEAEWLDDYFSKHEYGVKFKDGGVYRPEEVENN